MIKPIDDAGSGSTGVCGRGAGGIDPPGTAFSGGREEAGVAR
jgi:hypothetical protein